MLRDSKTQLYHICPKVNSRPLFGEGDGCLNFGDLGEKIFFVTLGFNKESFRP